MKWFMKLFERDTIKSVSSDIKNVKIFKFGTTGTLIIVFIVAIYFVAKSDIDLKLKEEIVSNFTELAEFIVKNWKGV